MEEFLQCLMNLGIGDETQNGFGYPENYTNAVNRIFNMKTKQKSSQEI
jgi:hypothetical protein